MAAHAVTFCSFKKFESTMSPIFIYEDKAILPLTKELRQLINITLSGGRFILIHPHYSLIREAMRLDIIEEERLDDLEIVAGQYEQGEMIQFSREDLLFLYSLLEITCRLFVCEIGDDLKRLAIECGDTNEEEFKRVRNFFLHQAESFLKITQEALSDWEEFTSLQERIEQLNILA